MKCLLLRREWLWIAAIALAVGSGCKLFEQIGQNLEEAAPYLEEKYDEAARTFIENPSPYGALSAVVQAITATLVAALGGVQLRDRNARRRVEEETRHLAESVAALIGAVGMIPPQPPQPAQPAQPAPAAVAEETEVEA